MATTSTGGEKKPSTAAKTPARETATVGEPEAQTDRVAMVSRDKDGKPDQSADFELLVPDHASDEEKKAALNEPPKADA